MNLYNTNGLLFWSEGDIRKRNMFEEYFVQSLKENLKSQNRGFDFHKCEAPLLTPSNLLNPNYTDADVWMQSTQSDPEDFYQYVKNKANIEADKPKIDALSKKHMRPPGKDYYTNMILLNSEIISLEGDINRDTVVFSGLFAECQMVYTELYQATLVLRPETTMGSYVYAKHLLNPHNDTKVKPPIVVYQHGKSFRREQDQPTKFMRLKEFYQLEFQIIYSANTFNDYSVLLIPAVCSMISNMIGPCHVEDSDRIPSYAEWTKDVICDKSGMEVCSISKRKDYEGMNVLEIAIGTDRVVYNFNNK